MPHSCGTQRKYRNIYRRNGDYMRGDSDRGYCPCPCIAVFCTARGQHIELRVRALCIRNRRASGRRSVTAPPFPRIRKSPLSGTAGERGFFCVPRHAGAGCRIPGSGVRAHCTEYSACLRLSAPNASEYPNRCRRTGTNRAMTQTEAKDVRSTSAPVRKGSLF